MVFDPQVYEDPLSNILRKAISISYLDSLEKNFEIFSSRFNEADIKAFCIKGTGAYNYFRHDVPYPRNNNDIDMNILGGENYSPERAGDALQEMLAYTARNSGYELEKVRFNEDVGLHKFDLHITVNGDTIDGIIANAEYYYLSDREVDFLNQAQETLRKTPLDLILQLDCIAKMQIPDMAPRDRTGKTVDTYNSPSFLGFVELPPAAAVMGKLHALNDENRDNPLDALDLYNALYLYQQEPRELNSAEVGLFRNRFFNPGGNYRIRRQVDFPAMGDEEYEDFVTFCHDYMKHFYDKYVIEILPTHEQVNDMLNLAIHNSELIFPSNESAR